MVFADTDILAPPALAANDLTVPSSSISPVNISCQCLFVCSVLFLDFSIFFGFNPSHGLEILVQDFVGHFIAKLYARGKMNVKRLGD